MERRNFIKISALSGVMATLEACGNPEHQLIRFVPEEELVPGIATWKPSVCTLCSAGCGLLVRVMQGEAEVVRHGQRGLMKMGLAKKLEGNPHHPVNLGKLCARGQAGLQVLYHPDRITQPIKRTGARGSGEFQEITWEDALKELASHLSTLQSSKSTNSLAFLARPLRGQRRELIERFLKAFGAPPAVWYEPFDEAVLRQANLLSFGHAALPTFDLARADYVISFGADFLGTWNSPVAQSIGYGEMRQGRPGRRGKIRAGRIAHVADRRQRRRVDSVPAGNGRRAGAGHRARHLERKARAAGCGIASRLADRRLVRGLAGLHAASGREADRSERRGHHASRA